MLRLFWVPRGVSAKEGAYVRCPAEDLLRIIALESVLNGTVVIAEDLGTMQFYYDRLYYHLYSSYQG
ncbi:MAG TPA: hypothetical protein DCP92_07545 [Nitrospiraceae bacterium]|nr:hypothetical protein [Nitrospiraceae bacterium]